MSKKYIVSLTEEERTELEQLINTGKVAAHKRCHAQILLKADSSENGDDWKDWEISKAYDITTRTVERVRQRFVEQGLDAAINRAKQTKTRRRIIDGEREAYLIALSCSEAPEGRSHWTLQLLADKMVELKYVDTISDETVRRALKKTKLNLGKRRSGVYHPKPMRILSAQWKTLLRYIKDLMTLLVRLFAWTKAANSR